MKKILGLLLYATLMFGVTAGLGMFMLKKAATHGTDATHQDQEQADSAGEDDATGHSGDSHTSGQGAAGTHGDAADSHATDTHSSGNHAPVANTHRQDEQLPVAVRATPLSVEEIVRMGLSLKSRDEVVRRREVALRETESQQRLVLSDVSAAQQEIENLLAQAHDQRAATEELLSRLTKQKDAAETERLSLVTEKQQILTDRDGFDTTKRQIEKDRTQLALDQQQLQADRQKVDLDKRQNEGDREKLATDQKRLIQERDQLLADQDKFSKARMDASSVIPELGPAATVKTEPPIDDASRKQNLKELTEMFEGMSPEMAAKSIKVLSTSGETDMIVDVLTSLEQRKASAILDAISDEQLVSDFLMKINSRRNTQKAAGKN